MSALSIIALSTFAHSAATDFGSCGLSFFSAESTAGLLENWKLNVGEDASAAFEALGAKKSAGCGKSENQSVKPIWAFVFASPTVPKYTCWSRTFDFALKPIWL